VYVRKGDDMSLTLSKDLAVNLVQGMGGMTVNGGNGVLVLSQIRQVYQADCDAASLPNCANLGKRVFGNRIVIGNSALRASNFGTPPSQYLSSKGNINASDYLQQSSLVVSNFDDTLLPQASGDVAYVVEVYFDTPSLSFLGNSAGTYSRAIFGN
jgi:hypothetical protein